MKVVGLFRSLPPHPSLAPGARSYCALDDVHTSPSRFQAETDLVEIIAVDLGI